MANVRTLEDAVVSIVMLIDKLSDESREDCNNCAAELFELAVETDKLKAMERRVDVMLKQSEIERRVVFLDGLTNTIKEYMEVYEFV